MNHSMALHVMLCMHVMGSNSLILVALFIRFFSFLFFLVIISFQQAGHPRIIHRDIKASNILIDYSFEAKVCTLVNLISINIYIFLM